jgi:hypothetical protein
MNHPQNPSSGFPFSFIGPWWPQQQEYRTEDRSRINLEAPARVRVAMQFLEALSSKTMDRAAVNDISIELVHGQKLTDHEKDAQIAACLLLQQYFAGDMKANTQENIALLESRAPELRNSLHKCPKCVLQTGKRDANCNLCMGTGSIMVVPIVGREEELP